MRLGAAIFGAVVGGAYSSVEQAQKKMTGVKPTRLPTRSRPHAAVYAELYPLVPTLHDAFGTTGAAGSARPA